jgi:hypothetical protein
MKMWRVIQTAVSRGPWKEDVTAVPEIITAQRLGRMTNLRLSLVKTVYRHVEFLAGCGAGHIPVTFLGTYPISESLVEI